MSIGHLSQLDRLSNLSKVPSKILIQNSHFPMVNWPAHMHASQHMLATQLPPIKSKNLQKVNKAKHRVFNPVAGHSSGLFIRFLAEQNLRNGPIRLEPAVN